MAGDTVKRVEVERSGLDDLIDGVQERVEHTWEVSQILTVRVYNLVMATAFYTASAVTLGNYPELTERNQEYWYQAGNYVGSDPDWSLQAHAWGVISPHKAQNIHDGIEEVVAPKKAKAKESEPETTEAKDEKKAEEKEKAEEKKKVDKSDSKKVDIADYKDDPKTDQGWVGGMFDSLSNSISYNSNRGRIFNDAVRTVEEAKAAIIDDLYLLNIPGFNPAQKRFESVLSDKVEEYKKTLDKKFAEYEKEDVKERLGQKRVQWLEDTVRADAEEYKKEFLKETRVLVDQHLRAAQGRILDNFFVNTFPGELQVGAQKAASVGHAGGAVNLSSNQREDYTEIVRCWWHGHTKNWLPVWNKRQISVADKVQGVSDWQKKWSQDQGQVGLSKPKFSNFNGPIKQLLQRAAVDKDGLAANILATDNAGGAHAKLRDINILVDGAAATLERISGADRVKAEAESLDLLGEWGAQMYSAVRVGNHVALGRAKQPGVVNGVNGYFLDAQRAIQGLKKPEPGVVQKYVWKGLFVGGVYQGLVEPIGVGVKDLIKTIWEGTLLHKISTFAKESFSPVGLARAAFWTGTAMLALNQFPYLDAVVQDYSQSGGGSWEMQDLLPSFGFAAQAIGVGFILSQWPGTTRLTNWSLAFAKSPFSLAKWALWDNLIASKPAVKGYTLVANVAAYTAMTAFALGVLNCFPQTDWLACDVSGEGGDWRKFTAEAVIAGVVLFEYPGLSKIGRWTKKLIWDGAVKTIASGAWSFVPKMR